MVLDPNSLKANQSDRNSNITMTSSYMTTYLGSLGHRHVIGRHE